MIEFDIFDPNIMPWLVPAGPLLAFLIISFFTNRSKLVSADDHHEYGGHHPDYDGMLVPVVAPMSRVISIIVGMSGIISALLISWRLVIEALGILHFGTEDHVLEHSIAWMNTGDTVLSMGVLVDPLNVLLLFMVPLAVLCIFIYSIGYMAHDPRQSRFFALISLFAGAMLTLTVADNLLMLFVGWEVMGLCSYLLIGFWYEKSSAYNAAIKAFTTTRIADVVMLLGIVYLYTATGTLNFREILYSPETLEMLASTPAILVPAGWGLSAASLIGMLLITGTIGKSAQFPLHVWLPDAMEGPTPVSAMIHAAAMVSAGIYAIIRMYPVFSAGADPHHGVFTSPLVLMAVVGSFTALFAATMAIAQRDVKAVLAYSTISQLGFMMAALGIGGYIAAAFHLITHAFFKALLFMASGSVIHAMEHGEHHVHEHHAHDDHHHESHDEHADSHDDHDAEDAHGHGHFDPQDMWNMGGLKDRIPVTFYTFLIGGFALSGFPLITAGFWSKDEILAEAWLGTTHGYGLHALVFFMLAIAAFLTAFYTMRQISLTFLGEPRTEEAEHAGLGGADNIISQTMQLPLLILAVFAVIAGFVGVPTDFPILGSIFSPEHSFLHHFLEYSLIEELHAPAPPFNVFPVFVSFLVALGGLWLGYRMYGRKQIMREEDDPVRSMIGVDLFTTLQNRYYFDDLYINLFVKPSQAFARGINVILDKGIIDGVLHSIAAFFIWLGNFIKVMNSWLIDGVGDGIPRGIYDAGGWMRRFQSGRVQQYLLLVLIAAVLIGVFFALSSGAVTAG
ncbi:MAG: NADH-quinone oxidoreductase subunit L [Aggregatilineales bacterium]